MKLSGFPTHLIVRCMHNKSDNKLNLNLRVPQAETVSQLKASVSYDKRFSKELNYVSMLPLFESDKVTHILISTVDLNLMATLN